MKKRIFLFIAAMSGSYLHAQNVGIGTTAPKARLHVTDSAVLFSGSVSIPVTTPFPPPASGAGSRMMWYPQRAAFRVGVVDNTYWDKDSIGRFSFATGFNTIAKGEGAFASGVITNAFGNYSTSMGYYSSASGHYSTSIGNNTTSLGESSTSFGYFTHANGYHSTSLGSLTNANGQYSTSLGYITTAYGNYSTAMGYNTISGGLYATSLGFFTTANGAASTSLGFHTAASSSYATSLGNYTVASGENSVSMGDHTIASGTSSTSMGWLSTASGQGSTSMGSSTFANGFASTSLGVFTTANGPSAVSMGISTISNGQSTTSMGGNTRAYNDYSTTMGYYTVSRSNNSLVVGTFNDTTNFNRLFEVGNGSGDNTRSNAVTVLTNGNTGLGTSQPLARLQVADSSVVFTGPLTTPVSTTYAPPISGQGTRLMWYPQKAAFRAGWVVNNYWDKDSIGRFSFAANYNTKAKGLASTSMGFSTSALGDESTSMGLSTFAYGEASLSTGYNNFANGTATAVMGRDNIANSDFSMVVGRFNDIGSTGRLFEIGKGTADNDRSNALTVLINGNIGIGTATPGFPLNFPNTLGDKISLYGNNGNHYGFGIQGSLLQIHSETFATDIAFGYGSSASFIENVRLKGNGNVGIGNSNPTRPLSFPAALGEKILLYPGPNGETGIGVYGNELRLHADNTVGKISFGTQTNAGVYSENALAQRNGVYAFSVLGSLWVNGTTYASDERFKQNITTIASPLQKLMQLNGVEYEMKTAEFDTYHFQPGRQMGLLAQNVETVVPEAVNEKDGYKGVDYARLVPLLIEAIKEQQQQRNKDLLRIEKLEKQLKDLQIK
jgi:hypothetical protein